MQTDRSDRFMAHLRELDRGALAELRRSLAFAPGAHVPAFRYVESFAPQGRLRRAAYYLTAGLYALHPTHVEGRDFGWSVRELQRRHESESTEARFLALLDSDSEQLPNRLRQMVSLVKSHEVGVDWGRMLADVLQWGHPDRYVQIRWAQSFYASAPDNAEGGPAQTADATTQGEEATT